MEHCYIYVEADLFTVRHGDYPLHHGLTHCMQGVPDQWAEWLTKSNITE